MNLINDKIKCPSCKCDYSPSNRRLTDECGHASCVKCIVNSIPCTICKQNSQETDDEDMDIDFVKIDEIIKQASAKKESSFDKKNIEC